MKRQKNVTYHPDLLERVEKLADHTERLNVRLDRITLWMEQSRLQDLLMNYTQPRRVFWLNLLAGLSRGLGLTLGTAIVISLLSILLSELSHIPYISDTIQQLKKIVDHSSPHPR
jgi:Domain of unknown function (DUF5665)